MTPVDLDLARMGRSDLLAEIRRLRTELVTGNLLPGWTCPSCRAFNGAAKELLPACRCCAAPAP